MLLYYFIVLKTKIKPLMLDIFNITKHKFMAILVELKPNNLAP